MLNVLANRIADEVLAELWFGFKQQVLNSLQTAFRDSKLKQEDIGARVGKDPATISRCLRGNRDMSLRTMHDLARGMNCRLRVEIDSLREITPRNKQREGSWRDAGNSDADTATSGSSNTFQVLPSP